MKKLAKRLIVLAALAAAAGYLWQQRDRLALLSNNRLRIQGTWYQVEMDRKGVDPYSFDEKIITLDGTEWGSYEMRKNTVIEVMIADELGTYRLDFPDDENMVWWAEIDGDEVAAYRWRR